MRWKSLSWIALFLAAFLSAAVCAAGPSPAPSADNPAPAPPAEAPAPRPPPPAWRPPLLDRAAMLKAAADVTLAKYPDADDVLVDDRITVRYEADGTSVTFDETWEKVLTEKGRREDDSLPIGFNAAYGDASVDILEVVKPDGTAFSVDVAAQGRVTIEAGQMGENIFDPNHKVLDIGIPNLAVGDIVHYRAIERTTKAAVPDTWSDYTELQSTSPIRHFSYEVSGPAERPLRSIAIRDEVPGTATFSKSEEAGRIHYLWVAHDVPRIFEEPKMPPVYTCVQRLLVSTIPDWKDISLWYWKLSLPHLTATEPMKEMVATLTQGIDALPVAAEEKRQDKIKALFKFVSQKIRYLGLTFETEAPGYEPHDAGVTFENKFGVCRDKAALLVAMLRAAGIEAFPTLIQVGPKKDAGVPQPYFNHAIVAARNPDGAWQLMDPTDENTRELMPAYLSNDSYLVATPEGETLATSPITPAAQNLMQIETTAELSPDGDLSAGTTLHFDGFNDNAYRDYFSHIQPQERRVFFERLVRRVAPGARLDSFEIKPADLMDTAVPLTVRLTFQAPGATVRGDGVIILPFPSFGTHVGMVNFLLGSAGLAKRKFPMVTDVACGVNETLTLHAPSLGPTVALPKYESFESPSVSLTETVTRANETLRRSGSFLMKVVEFTPTEYLNLKTALRVMQANERQWALFAVPRAPADATVLSDTASYELTGAHAWTETRAVRLKVLTYAGAQQHLDLKVRFNPAWEKASVESATVTNPDGSVHTAGKGEQVLMDEAWVGGAPRYPAGKTLVVTLPGVEIGSVIEYQVKRSCTERPFFAVRESFRGRNPVQSMSLTVLRDTESVTQEPRTETRLGSGLQHATIIIGGGRRYACDQWTAADQPAVEPESQLPPLWAFTPTVCVSTGDWKAYASEVESALDAAASGQDEARRMAEAVVLGAGSDDARALAIRDYLARQVRAAGPGLDELPLSALTPADRTLADAYGDSADRAILLYAMLRAAGLKPAFVLASDEPVVPDLANPLRSCPSPADFGSVLVRVRLGGADVYLNDTDQYASLGSTPHDGCYGLDLPGGNLCTLRAAPGKEDRSETTYGIELKPNGDALIRKAERCFGMGYAAKRKMFAEMVPEQRVRYFQEAVAAIAQAAVAAGSLRTEFEGRYPGIEEFTVRVPGYAVRDGNYLCFALPASLRDFFGFGSETRVNPVYWPSPRRVSLATELSLPPEFRAAVVAPQAVDWQAPRDAGSIRFGPASAPPSPATGDMTWAAPGAADGASPCFGMSAQLRPALIPASDYDELLRVERLLNRLGAYAVVLKAK